MGKKKSASKGAFTNVISKTSCITKQYGNLNPHCKNIAAKYQKSLRDKVQTAF